MTIENRLERHCGKCDEVRTFNILHTDYTKRVSYYQCNQCHQLISKAVSTIDAIQNNVYGVRA